MDMEKTWLNKNHEMKLLQVVEWSQRAGKPVEELTEEDIREALREKAEN